MIESVTNLRDRRYDIRSNQRNQASFIRFGRPFPALERYPLDSSPKDTAFLRFGRRELLDEK